MSQYELLYRKKIEVRQKVVKLAIQNIVSQERILQEIRKCIATRPPLSQDQ